MKLQLANNRRFWALVALLLVAACSVAAVWAYAEWLDAPDRKPLTRAPQGNDSTPVSRWCCQIALAQILSYGFAVIVAAVCWVVALFLRRRWSWSWTIYLLLWSYAALNTSYARYVSFGRNVSSYSLSNVPLMSSESLGSLLLFFVLWIMLPLIIYTLLFWIMLKRNLLLQARAREFRVFLYLIALVLLVNGLYLEPATWRVPRDGGGMENALGPFGAYVSFILGWHLRNHLMLLATFLAIKSYFNSANDIPIAEPIQSVQPVFHAAVVTPDHGNPYRY